MSKCQGAPDQTFLEGDILNHLEGCVEGDHASNDWTFIIKPGCIATVFDGEPPLYAQSQNLKWHYTFSGYI